MNQARRPCPCPAIQPGVVLVRTVPSTLVVTPEEGGGLAPAAMYGLADGIRITAGRHRHIADFLVRPGEVPLTCNVEVTGERQPPRPDSDAAGIGVALDRQARRVGLQLGPALFEQWAEAPSTAHEWLGMADGRGTCPSGGSRVASRSGRVPVYLRKRGWDSLLAAVDLGGA